ncbi:MAG: c-type cytochrome [Candidatus Eisenbacteria bacterium]|nr:c-type cytochrome [Candidatus Eisenbacteria bacterium]
MLNKAYAALIGAALSAAFVAGCGTQPAAERSSQLYETCMPCHGSSGEGNLALRAPAIAGLPKWYVLAQLEKFKKGVRGAHPDDMEGHRMRPMARSLLGPNDPELVADHVSKMRAVWEKPDFAMADTSAGGTTYRGLCVTCHGEGGEGNEALGAPPITRQHDWYMVAQLRKFQSGMRGSNPDDITGAQMRAMSLTLADSVAMHDVVSYVKTLPH